MEGIKNLVIDFGGVIINLTRNRCIEAFESLGVANIREQIVNNYQHKDLFMKIELGSITVAEFREGIRHLTRQPLTDEQIDAAWIAMLDDVPDYKLDLLLDLRKRYNTMLLSNTNEIHWDWSEKTCFSYKGHHASDFFNHIYGEGTSEKLFGDKVSLTLCMDAFESFMKQKAEQEEAFNKRAEKYKGNRSQRRKKA